MALLGIDLGTTYCAVATLDARGRPVTVPNGAGEVLTPSAVYFAPDGSVTVGAQAFAMALQHPDRVAALVKRQIGRPDFGRTVAGRTFRPETLSAIILRKLAQEAAAAVGPEPQCVITVPAYFDDTRRKATMDAGRIAGLEVIDILDEPSAAALAYSLQQPADELAAAARTILVYDLGGGTFDVTLVKLSKKRFHVLAIEGDVRLGGTDWDDRMANWAANQFQKQHGTDPRTDEHSLARLNDAAKRAKRALSRDEQATLAVSHGGQESSLTIARSEFEKLTQDLLVRTRLTTQQVLNQSGLSWEKVDRVLMVGGSTLMPMVGRMLAEVTGKAPDHSLAVSEVVAHGAAVHAGIAHQREELLRNSAAPVLEMLEGVVEISVNAHSLGIEVRQDTAKVNNKLIVKNSQLPAAASRVYYTTKPGQEKVRVRIMQGEAHQAEACIPVGECWIEGLPGDLPRGSPVQVRCGVTANGRIEIMALDMTSGRMATAEIHRPTGLTDAEIAAESAWVRGLKIH